MCERRRGAHNTGGELDAHSSHGHLSNHPSSNLLTDLDPDPSPWLAGFHGAFAQVWCTYRAGFEPIRDFPLLIVALAATCFSRERFLSERRREPRVDSAFVGVALVVCICICVVACAPRHEQQPLHLSMSTSGAGKKRWRGRRGGRAIPDGGYMRRTAESLLATALQRVGDAPEAPFSVHQIALVGKAAGEEVGVWFGLSAAGSAFKALVDGFQTCGLEVYVAIDNTLYQMEVLRRHITAHGHGGSTSSTSSLALPPPPTRSRSPSDGGLDAIADVEVLQRGDGSALRTRRKDERRSQTPAGQTVFAGVDVLSSVDAAPIAPPSVEKEVLSPVDVVRWACRVGQEETTRSWLLVRGSPGLAIAVKEMVSVYIEPAVAPAPTAQSPSSACGTCVSVSPGTPAQTPFEREPSPPLVVVSPVPPPAAKMSIKEWRARRKLGRAVSRRKWLMNARGRSSGNGEKERQRERERGCERDKDQPAWTRRMRSPLRRLRTASPAFSAAAPNALGAVSILCARSFTERRHPHLQSSSHPSTTFHLLRIAANAADVSLCHVDRPLTQPRFHLLGRRTPSAPKALRNAHNPNAIGGGSGSSACSSAPRFNGSANDLSLSRSTYNQRGGQWVKPHPRG
ncbi:hypothetical protein MVEN_01143300 [Mycena venus]|uniref:Cysteine protease n=1 Tax=Mycena venus TaxID=2733690 RepID=A0A8H7CXI3_9AGAR|nr:hypothetical protein MVEN_01143300 [Mycena venus]